MCTRLATNLVLTPRCADVPVRIPRKPRPPYDADEVARAPGGMRAGRPAHRRVDYTRVMSASDYQYSMVVDWLGSHPYQVEVLLFTLEAFANVPRRQMVVQCTDRVSDDVVAKLSAQGYTVTKIAPYLDQAYCNKIAQLDYFVDSTDARGVFLLDLDLAILAELDIPNRDVVCGKLVDGANPPLDTLRQLFDAAGVELPAIMPSDWEGRGDTIATNLNGGFLYVPRAYVGPLRNKWRHWAEFLFAKPDLFDHPSARKHTDQIAFAMALASAQIPFRHLPTNWNYPGHKDRVPRAYRGDEPLRVLHYHDRLGRFGLIDAAESDRIAVEDAVNRVNSALSERDGPSLFYDLHREDIALRAIGAVPALPASTFSNAFIARTWIGNQKRRLILHAGTPKTGTSSLQFHLGTHRRELMAEGWWYPAPSDTPEPKHQQVNALLRQDDPEGFVRYIETALADMPDDAHTVLLTTEGIFNHWWDYGPRAKGVLRLLAALFDFELCVWFRPPEDFAAALYTQYLRNPRRPTESMGNVYGRDIDFTEALADGWFRGHLDYLGFYHEAQALFGASRVKAFPFADDTVTTFLEHYGLRGSRGLPAEAPRRNTSLGRAGVDLMRIANRHALDDDDQAHVADLVRDIDATIGDRAERFRLTPEERQLVQRFSAPGWRTLQPLLGDGSTPARRRVLKPKVFGIGFHNTGTKSLGQALGALGYRVTGPNGAQDPVIADHAVAIALSLATEHDGFSDNPWALLYKELDATFPGSRFILTVRDEERWIESARQYFGTEETPMREWVYGVGSPVGNEATYLSRYRQHNQAVTEYFQGRDDLLVLDLERGHGWSELCGFLGVPAPNSPFPHVKPPPR